MTPEAERFNGWAAMLGFVAAVGAYATTGNIIPGIEVKSDQKSKYTGNIVVEIAFDGKRSALCVTKAKYWMFYDGYGFVVIKPNRIWDCINENKLVPVNFIGNGDTKQKTAYLIKKNILYEYKER